MQPAGAGNPYVVGFPSLAGDGSAFGTNMTGYVMLKHVQIDYTGDYISEYKGSTPAIQFRYADVLLNYAEALAEKNGAANAGKIIEVLQSLCASVPVGRILISTVQHNTSAAKEFRLEIWINISKLYAANAGWKKHWKVVGYLISCAGPLPRS